MLEYNIWIKLNETMYINIRAAWFEDLEKIKNTRFVLLVCMQAQLDQKCYVNMIIK